jgi:hypothetical protein
MLGFVNVAMPPSALKLKVNPGKLQITHIRLLELVTYHADTGLFTRNQAVTACGVFYEKDSIAGSRPNQKGRAGRYCQIKLDNVMYKAHNLAVLYMTTNWPKNLIDHIDGNGNNNIWTNLREATASQNRFNMPAYVTNTSGCKGVNFHTTSGKWQARAYIEGKRHFLGAFNTKEEAVTARITFAKLHHGEFYHE